MIAANMAKWREAVMLRAMSWCEQPDCMNRATAAHHIQTRGSRPDLRLETDNGMALCAKCHDNAHGIKWGATKGTE